MKILLVTATDKLVEKFSALNPELEYCAAVVDNVDSAKEILSKVPLYPMSELQNCVESLQYDYVLCVQNAFYEGLLTRIKKCGLSTKKVIGFADLPGLGNFKQDRLLRYYQANAAKIEMFITGISPTEAGIDIRQFKCNAINLAASSQDLYYDFSIAKFVMNEGKKYGKLRYALIGIAPYSFHFDLSRTYGFQTRMLPFFIAFNDLHNFHMPASIYKKFFREEWLAKKVSIEKLAINGVNRNEVMDISSDKGLNPWKGKYYPETRAENVKIFEDYLVLCDENNIRPIMTIVPTTEKYMATFDKRLLEDFYSIIEQALLNHPAARFVDGWKWGGVTYDDFYNHAHLNIHGETKFSKYLNEFIEQLER